MTPMDRFEKLSDALGGEIGRIRDALAAEEAVDAQRIAGIVADIHDAAGGLSAAEAAVAKPRLLGLLADLDAVQAQMTQAHAAMQDQLRGASDRQRAATAYTRPPRR